MHDVQATIARVLRPVVDGQPVRYEVVYDRLKLTKWPKMSFILEKDMDDRSGLDATDREICLRLPSKEICVRLVCNVRRVMRGEIPALVRGE